MKKTLIIAVLGILSAHISQAAVLKFIPLGNNQVGLIMDTEKESVNALEAHVTFDPKEFSVSGISDGGSVVDLWLEHPTVSNDAGTIDISGIVPGGIDTPQGTIITITIVPEQTGTSGGFTIVSGRVLLNDGKGTPAKLSFSSNPFPITTAPLSTSTSPVDTEAPGPFTPEIARDQNLFGGQYFLVFAATDIHSGIDHYEILEVPRGKSGSIVSWQEVQSPYVLRDQTLSSDIYLRAVDKTGNFRVVKLPATSKGVSFVSSPRAEYLLPFAILIGIGILWLAWRKKIR
jgi:hypothetical protein